ncbi:MAG: serine hydrolase, partial [Kofleriaceae bacterium]
MTAHPENTRRRQELRGPRRALIGVLCVVAALAIFAIVRLAAGPVSIGMLLVLAALQVAAAGFLAGRLLRARSVALVAALAAIAWGIEQILVTDVVTWFSLALLGTMQPTSPFGEVFQYSNLMASAAGYIGAHLYDPSRELGTAYDEAMQKKIFTPLGMNSTTFDMARAQKGN